MMSTVWVVQEFTGDGYVDEVLGVFDTEQAARQIAAFDRTNEVQVIEFAMNEASYPYRDFR